MPISRLDLWTLGDWNGFKWIQLESIYWKVDSNWTIFSIKFKPKTRRDQIYYIILYLFRRINLQVCVLTKLHVHEECHAIFSFTQVLVEVGRGLRLATPFEILHIDELVPQHGEPGFDIFNWEKDWTNRKKPNNTQHIGTNILGLFCTYMYIPSDGYVSPGLA